MKWWETQGRAKLQPAWQEIRATRGIGQTGWSREALVPRKRRRQSHDVKLRTMGTRWMLLSLQRKFGSAPSQGISAQEMAVPGQQTQNELLLPEHLELTAAKLQCVEAHLQLDLQQAAGDSKPSLLGTWSYQETAALIYVPFFSPRTKQSLELLLPPLYRQRLEGMDSALG